MSGILWVKESVENCGLEWEMEVIRVEAMRRINCMEDLGDEIITVVSAVLTLKGYPQAHRKNHSSGSRRKGCNNEERPGSCSSRNGHSVCGWDYPAIRKAPSSAIAGGFSSSAHYILSGNGKGGFHLICLWEAGSLLPTLGNLLFVVFEARPRSPNWFCPSLNCPFLWEIKLGTFLEIEIHTGYSRRERSNVELNWGLSHGSICTSVSIALQSVTVLSCG